MALSNISHSLKYHTLQALLSFGTHTFIRSYGEWAISCISQLGILDPPDIWVPCLTTCESLPRRRQPVSVAGFQQFSGKSETRLSASLRWRETNWDRGCILQHWAHTACADGNMSWVFDARFLPATQSKDFPVTLDGDPQNFTMSQNFGRFRSVERVSRVGGFPFQNTCTTLHFFGLSFSLCFSTWLYL